ncbi:hypothetical protein C7B61_00160 [filamentous cyanobacterium CCP1]|nr:hypothetical protein C7B61_00160 [filamentous cyanobacterium CCP1]
MADIHLFGGEKGGVGKSLVCRAAVQYHLDNKLDVSVFDTDRSNPDVRRIYGDAAKCRVAVFSEGEKYEDKANQIYNAALKKRVLCNLPAQVMIPVRNWFENNELLEIAAEDGVRFYQWFVSDGGYDSLNLLGKSMESLGPTVQHIMVKNYGKSDDWEAFEQDEALQALLVEQKAIIVNFPKFIGSVERNRMDSENMTFAQAREDKQLGSISRQRVKKFLREAYAAFEEVGVF